MFTAEINILEMVFEISMAKLPVFEDFNFFISVSHPWGRSG